jgi:hypothetical protein
VQWLTECFCSRHEIDLMLLGSKSGVNNRSLDYIGRHLTMEIILGVAVVKWRTAESTTDNRLSISALGIFLLRHNVS